MCALILDKREVYMKLGLKLCGVVVPELQRRVCEGDVRKASPKLARLREHLVIIYIRSVSRSPEKLQSHTETNRRTFDVRKQTQFHRRAHTQPYYGARFSAVAHRGAILKVSKPDSSVRPSVTSTPMKGSHEEVRLHRGFRRNAWKQGQAPAARAPVNLKGSLFHLATAPHISVQVCI